MKSPRSAILVLGLFLFAQPARAEIITIDPGAFTIGTDLSALMGGFTLTQVSQSGGYTYDPTRTPLSNVVYDAYGNTGIHALGGTYLLAEYERCLATAITFPCESWTVIEMAFDTPTDFVQMGSVWLSDSPTMIAYDAAGQIVGQCISLFGDGSPVPCASTTRGATFGGPWTMTSAIRSDERNISRIIFGGTVGSSHLTHISHNVPEPTTLLSLGLGVAFAGFCRRRRFGQ